MTMEGLPKRRSRLTNNTTNDKKAGEKYTVATEMMRLERKKVMYDKQEMALKKMQNVVSDQMLKVEVEALQLAANIREKEMNELSEPLDEENSCKNVAEDPNSQETVHFDDAEEVNKNKLDLETCLEEMLYNEFCPATAEEDDEDEMKFHFL
ncbi:uncharacterized protein [Hetaerina americana]|uniref:uncharacterized protein n=1 Tax=Hetaerina americana TaxID=62018 RepID=UPI003A7F2D52